MRGFIYGIEAALFTWVGVAALAGQIDGRAASIGLGVMALAEAVAVALAALRPEPRYAGRGY